MKTILSSALKYGCSLNLHRSQNTCLTPSIPFLVISPQFLNVMPEIFLSIFKQQDAESLATNHKFLKKLVDFIEVNSPTFHLQLVCLVFSELETVEVMAARFEKMDYIFHVVILESWNEDYWLDEDPNGSLHSLWSVDENKVPSNSDNDASLLPPLSRFGRLLLSRSELRSIRATDDKTLNSANLALTLLTQHKSSSIRQQALNILRFPRGEAFWRNDRRVDLLLDRIETMFRDDIVDDESAKGIFLSVQWMLYQWLWKRIGKSFSRIQFLVEFIIQGFANVRTPKSVQIASMALAFVINISGISELFGTNSSVMMEMKEFIPMWLDRVQSRLEELIPTAANLYCCKKNQFGDESTMKFSHRCEIETLLYPINLFLFVPFEHPGTGDLRILYHHRMCEFEPVFENFFQKIIRLTPVPLECVWNGLLRYFVQSKFARHRENFFSELFSSVITSGHATPLRRNSLLVENDEENKQWVDSTSFLHGVTVRDFVGIACAAQIGLDRDASFRALVDYGRDMSETFISDANLLIGRPSDSQNVRLSKEEFCFLLRRQALPLVLLNNIWIEDRWLAAQNSEDFWEFVYPSSAFEEAKETNSHGSDDDDDENGEDENLSSCESASDSSSECCSDSTRSTNNSEVSSSSSQLLNPFVDRSSSKFVIEDWIFTAFNNSAVGHDNVDVDVEGSSSVFDDCCLPIGHFFEKLVVESYGVMDILEMRSSFVKDFMPRVSRKLFFYVDLERDADNNDDDGSDDRLRQKETHLLNVVRHMAVKESKMLFEQFFMDVVSDSDDENKNKEEGSHRNNSDEANHSVITSASPKIQFWGRLLNSLFKRSNCSKSDTLFVNLIVYIFRLQKLYNNNNNTSNDGCSSSSSSRSNSHHAEMQGFDVVKFVGGLYSSSESKLLAIFLEHTDLRGEHLRIRNYFELLPSQDNITEEYYRRFSRDLSQLVVEAWKVRKCTTIVASPPSSDDAALKKFRDVIVGAEANYRQEVEKSQIEEFTTVMFTKMRELRRLMGMLNEALLHHHAMSRRQREE